MCLAIPAVIKELNKDLAKVDAMGNIFNTKTTLLPKAKKGDIVLVHAGFAISIIDEQAAEETWELIKKMEELKSEQDETE